MVGLFSVYTPLPSPSWIRLKEPAIAGYIYNPSKPPFEKGGFFVSLWLTTPSGESVYISYHSSLRQAINSAQI